jgi:hypothetical protein
MRGLRSLARMVSRALLSREVDPYFLAAREAARVQRRAAIRSLGDEDIDRILRGIEREFTVPGPRDGGV